MKKLSDSAFGLLPKNNLPGDEIGLSGELWEMDGKLMMRFAQLRNEWVEVTEVPANTAKSVVKESLTSAMTPMCNLAERLFWDLVPKFELDRFSHNALECISLINVFLKQVQRQAREELRPFNEAEKQVIKETIDQARRLAFEEACNAVEEYIRDCDLDPEKFRGIFKDIRDLAT